MNKVEFLNATSLSLSETPKLLYTVGHKYQARSHMIYDTGITGYEVEADLVTLRKDGFMLVEPYFAWDGCSSLAIDTKSNMRGGQAHDALAALMRMGLLPLSCVKPSNEVIRRLMIIDGAWKFRADLYQKVLDKTEYWARPNGSKDILTAP